MSVFILQQTIKGSSLAWWWALLIQNMTWSYDICLLTFLSWQSWPNFPSIFGSSMSVFWTQICWLFILSDSIFHQNVSFVFCVKKLTICTELFFCFRNSDGDDFPNFPFVNTWEQNLFLKSSMLLSIELFFHCLF